MISLIFCSGRPILLEKWLLKIDREIKAIVQSPVEYATSRAKDKTFYARVEMGLKLFEEEVDEQRL